MMRKECFVKTYENWHPSYKFEGDTQLDGLEDKYLLRLSFGKILHYTDKEYYRVCVWGQDDFGMEKDFSKDQYKEAEIVFMKILSQKYLSKGYLEQLGFQNA